jgi:hypothetical protein
MKNHVPACLLLLGVLVFTACAHERPRPDRHLTLQTIYRPDRPPIYLYRDVH